MFATAQKLPQKPRRSLIPWIFVGAFGVIIAVNTVLIVAASKTFSGLVVAHPYQKGIEHDQLRAELDAQSKLGWRYVLTAEQRGERILLTLTFADREGRPLNDLNLEGEMERPVENLGDLPVGFQPDGAGRYRAEIALPEHGVWDLRAVARHGADHFLLAERVMLK